MFPFLAWFCSLPRTGKALVDDCGLMLQTRWRENAPKTEKFNFRLPSVAPKSLCLSSLIYFPNDPCFQKSLLLPPSLLRLLCRLSLPDINLFRDLFTLPGFQKRFISSLLGSIFGERFKTAMTRPEFRRPILLH